MNAVTLEPRRRAESDGIAKRDWFDLVVDGAPLSDSLKASVFDFISGLGWGFDQKGYVSRLVGLAPGDLPSGRVSIFVCPECGDAGCGTITAEVDRRGESVVWADFAYENDYDPSALDRSRFEDVGPFEFDGADLESLLSSGVRPVE